MFCQLTIFLTLGSIAPFLPADMIPSTPAPRAIKLGVGHAITTQADGSLVFSNHPLRCEQLHVAQKIVQDRELASRQRAEARILSRDAKEQERQEKQARAQEEQQKLLPLLSLLRTLGYVASDQVLLTLDDLRHFVKKNKSKIGVTNVSKVCHCMYVMNWYEGD